MTETASRSSTTVIELRKATPETLRSFMTPLSRAFGEVFTDAEFEADSQTFETDRIVGAYDGDELVGCAGAYTFRMTIPGGDVPTAGVTLVGVSPSHRRRGILRQMMRQQLDEIHDRGEPVAVLWASEGAIYQRFGYGLATLSGSLDIERARTAFLRPVEPDGRIRIVSEDDAARLFPVPYERVRTVTPGALSRTEAFWRWNVVRDAEYMRAGRGPKFLALYEVDGEPLGYAIYRLKSEWDERGPKSELLVLEVVAATPSTERDIWRWLFDVDLVGRIKAWRLPIPTSLTLRLVEPRRMGLTVTDGIWLRLVDLAPALAARSYATIGSIVFDVADPFCPWNAGRWRLDVSDGGGGSDAQLQVAIGLTDADPDLALDVADLGAAYLGGIRFAELANAGRIDELRAGAVRTADALFATDRAPWCCTPF
jgi:predicted acetyltransferase